MFSICHFQEIFQSSDWDDIKKLYDTIESKLSSVRTILPSNKNVDYCCNELESYFQFLYWKVRPKIECTIELQSALNAKLYLLILL